MNNTRNCREYSNKSMHIRAMEKLLHVVQQLSAAHDLETVMNITRHSVRDLLDSDGATFVLRDGEFCHYAEEDAIMPLWKGSRFPLEQCISGWVMLNREPVAIEDIYLDERIPIGAYGKTFVKSLATVPIRTSNPIGAIGCYWAEKHAATAEEIKMLQVLADTAGIALDNISSRNTVADKARQLEKAMEDTLLAVARMVEQKDLYTAGHQRRVAMIGTAIAEEMRWSKSRCTLVFRAGIVHDIGKIGIPSELLSKPAKLNRFEFDLIKTHPQGGYDILKDISLLLPIAEIILQHHERLDGSGYPHGLAGEEISAEALVLAVSDVFESMISHRPYRPAHGVDMAIAELSENKGRLYQPEAVDSLIRLVKDKGYQVPE